MNGIGYILNVLVVEKVTGTMSKMVVTLSTNIEATAVNVQRSSKVQTLLLLALPNFVST